MVTVNCSSVGRRLAAFLVAGILAGGLSACSETTGVPTSRVQVLLTDAPSDMIASAVVQISRVYLQGGGGESADGAGRVDLFNDPDSPHEFDLLELQRGATVNLTGVVEVDAGLYRGLRLVVDKVDVTLEGGFAFVDGGKNVMLRVPSGSESGIKVIMLDDVINIDGDGLVTITLDFDVDRNFVIQGGRGQSGIHGILFTPVLMELQRDQS